jgi:hypothetical protein
MMPQTLIRACRASVCSQSSGEKCQARESASPATPDSGHQQSGFAKNFPSMSRLGLYSGVGRRAHRIRSRRSPSIADRIPSATSARARRNKPEPGTGPASNSPARCCTEHLPRCTASATTARTSARSVMGRTASATARGGRAKRISPATQNGAGNREVRCSRAKATSARRVPSGTRTSTRLRWSLASALGRPADRPWRRSAAMAVSTLRGPAYRSAAISRCSSAGRPA